MHPASGAMFGLGEYNGKDGIRFEDLIHEALTDDDSRLREIAGHGGLG